MGEPKSLQLQSHTQLSHLSSSIVIQPSKATAEDLSRARDPKIIRKLTPPGTSWGHAWCMGVGSSLPVTAATALLAALLAALVATALTVAALT
jgi:hypothetical protein